MVKRDLLSTVEAFLSKKEYLAIIGPRQAGKTVLFGMIAEHLRKNKNNNVITLTFEDRTVLKQFSSSPVEFIMSYIKDPSKKTYILLDEFQYAKNGGQKLKLIYDTVDNLKILVTGSSSLDIKTQTGKYMVGRMLAFNLYPFNFAEFLLSGDDRLEKIYRNNNARIHDFMFGGKKQDVKTGQDVFYDEMIEKYSGYLVWGGYPAVLLEKNKDMKSKIMNDIQNNYILKDIKGLLALATEDSLMKLAENLAAQLGGILNHAVMTNLSGLEYRALKKHMKILSETYVCSEVKPFYTNKLKEISKAPKVYFIDNGFRNSLVEDFRPPDKRQDTGMLAENVVFRRLLELNSGLHPLRYWRTKTGAEVDFVIKVEGETVPVEVKYSLFKETAITRSYANFIERFKPDRGIILTKNYWAIEKHNGTTILYAPVYYL